MNRAAPELRAVYYGRDETVEAGLDEPGLEKVLASGDGLLWLCLTTESPDSVRLLRDVFHFHQLAIDDCTNGRVDTPKVDDYGDYLFVVAQGVVYEAVTERLRLEELDLFLGPNYVVTIKPSGQLPSVDRLFKEAQANRAHLSRGADFLCHTILDVIVDELLPAVEAMDERLEDLEQRILERPVKSLLTEVLLMKRNALRLRRSILPERDMVNRLSRGEFEHLIGTDSLMFYRDVYDHTVRVESLLEGVRDLADSALSSYLSALNNRMNEIMKAMSVVAVIFLPLTLIASIYGTNLDFSPFGLTLEGGFYWMLGAMLLVSGAMIAYFRRRGWF